MTTNTPWFPCYRSPPLRLFETENISRVDGNIQKIFFLRLFKAHVVENYLNIADCIF